MNRFAIFANSYQGQLKKGVENSYGLHFDGLFKHKFALTFNKFLNFNFFKIGSIK